MALPSIARDSVIRLEFNNESAEVSKPGLSVSRLVFPQSGDFSHGFERKPEDPLLPGISEVQARDQVSQYRMSEIFVTVSGTRSQHWTIWLLPGGAKRGLTKKFLSQAIECILEL